MDERTLRTAAAIEAAGADWGLLTSVDTVCYATGHAGSIEWGPSPFDGGPNLALIARDGTGGIVVSNLDDPSARADAYISTVRSYEGISAFRHPPVHENYAAAVRALAEELGVGGTCAFEAATCPAAVVALLDDQISKFVDIIPELTCMRSTKTDAEIQALTACADLTSVGQIAAYEASRAGRRELEAFADIRCAMELHANQRIPITGDFISGVDKTASSEGWPDGRVLTSGDPIICDLAPRYRGYWGDSCNTLVIGDPPEAFIALHEISKQALATAAEIMHPGLAVSELDRQVRNVIEDAGYRNLLHTGHGIGTSSHEWPRIVEHETGALEAGMVLMIEPGAYLPGVGGARVEWMFRITDTGNEVMSTFKHVLTTESASNT